MPRPRKIETEQEGHRSTPDKENRSRETELAKGKVDRILTPPEDRLAGQEALDKWQFIVDIKQDNGTLDDSDFDNLVVYCNAWQSYMDGLKKLKSTRSRDPDTINAWLRMEKQSTDILYRYGARLGLDLNSRLKIAAVKVQQEQAEVDKEFGAI